MRAASEAVFIAVHPGTIVYRTHKLKPTGRRARSVSGSSMCSVHRRMRGAGESQDRFTEPRLQPAEVGNPGADGHRIKVKALYSFDRSSGRRRSGEKRRSNCKQHPTLCPHAAKSTIVRGVLLSHIF